MLGYRGRCVSEELQDERALSCHQSSQKSGLAIHEREFQRKP